MAMNQRRWVGVVLSAAWLAGVTGYEISTWRAARRSAQGVVTPLCEQADETMRAKCENLLSGFYVHQAAHHAVEVVALAALACLLGWVFGLIVIKRLSPTS